MNRKRRVLLCAVIAATFYILLVPPFLLSIGAVSGLPAGSDLQLTVAVTNLSLFPRDFRWNDAECATINIRDEQDKSVLTSSTEILREKGCASPTVTIEGKSYPIVRQTHGLIFVPFQTGYSPVLYFIVNHDMDRHGNYTVQLTWNGVKSNIITVVVTK